MALPERYGNVPESQTLSLTHKTIKKQDRKTITCKFFAPDFKAWVMDVESLGNDRRNHGNDRRNHGDMVESMGND